MKIIDYKILKARDIDELVKVVNECIKNDWVPIGGVSVYKAGSDGGNSEYFLQTVVKYES